MESTITDSFVYKWRYQIGYALIAIGLISILIFAGLYIPGGISNQEIASTITSSDSRLDTLFTVDVVNLPYHLLQHVSIRLFGVSNLSIKLPSIILAFFSMIGLVLLLKQWFKPNIGMLASLIAITTGQFLFIAQNGTPEILYVFWPVWLILTASYIPIKEKYRKLYVAAFFALAALSLYTPLSLYVLAVICGSIIIHPHLRFLTKQLSKAELAIGFITILIIVAPLLYAMYKSPEIGLHLLGWPGQSPDIFENLKSLAVQYFGFASAGTAASITPFFELGSVLLIGLGGYYVFKTKATAKSYVVILWTLCLIPVVVLNPDLTSVTFLPLVLLLSSGLNGLLAHWYDLFPRNPYARVGGLIPIVILVVVLVYSGIGRYIYGYTYGPNIVRGFNSDLRYLPKNTRNLLVSTKNNELSFYSVVAKFNNKITVTTVPPTSDEFLATQAAKGNFRGYQIDKVITSPNSTASDRFYLYKKIR